jgi:two-component sensor histidine kinase
MQVSDLRRYAFTHSYATIRQNMLRKVLNLLVLEASLRRTMLLASVVFTMATSAIAAVFAVRDYQYTISQFEERTLATARMIGAHGSAAVESALQIVAGILPVVESWDLKDQAVAEQVHARLREAANSGSLVSSAWVLNAEADSIADSWSSPPRPSNGKERPYFKAHMQGSPGPIILADERPGSISGKKRFTVSRAVRNDDGSLRAVVVVGIYVEPLERLYTQVANWPGARAGLYTIGGGVLARVQSVGRASPAFIAEMEKRVAQAPTGTATFKAEEEARIASWYRSDDLPQLYATSSVVRSVALSSWWDHTILNALLTLAANIVFWAYAYLAVRNGEARQNAAANELAVREIHHRLKNSLQLISSLINMRARKLDDPELRSVVNEITHDLKAVAEVHTLAHNASAVGTIDICKTVGTLCSYLDNRDGKHVVYRSDCPVIIDANHATALSVIVNELIMNGMKYGTGDLTVKCDGEGDMLRLSVHTSGARLPEDFAIQASSGFGLRALQAMVSAFQGNISGENRPTGVLFTVAVPVNELRRKQ